MSLLFQIECFFVFMFLFVPQASAEPASQNLRSLADEAWEFKLKEDPLYATSTGDHRWNDRLPKVSLEDCARRELWYQGFLDRLNQVERENLSAEEKYSFDILLRLTRDKVAEYKFQTHLRPINQRSGFHIEFPELPKNVPLNTREDYDNYLSRLKAFGDYTDGHIQILREGITTDQTLPVIVFDGWEQSIDAQIHENAEDSLLYEPCLSFPSQIPESEHDRICRDVKEAISLIVIPGYQRFRQFMAEEYLPQARGSIGASALPNGREFYRHRIHRFTTLNLTPEEIHNLGLSEVKRIRIEMEKIIRKVEFKGDFSAFTEFLREDPRFYASSKEELLKEVSYALKEMDGKLPELFGRLPRMPYGLQEVPEFIAPRTTAAYYQRPAGDGTRAGFFFMNTYNLKSRPLYTVEALSFHEAVPGHHLQLALQQEIEDLPPFRRYSGFTAFVEGWALYSERLGSEVGFYEDPYSDFGRLTMEIWRACRLVVDSGIHYFGWSREKAIRYFQQNTALSMHNIRSEVDRYISWPGQALAYKIGELKIRELRKKAEQELGAQFEIRTFHDTVLSGGSVPLDVLEARVIDWIDKQSAEE